jgi:hypothetical protein
MSPFGRRGMPARTMARWTPVELAPIALAISTSVCPASVRRQMSSRSSRGLIPCRGCGCIVPRRGREAARGPRGGRASATPRGLSTPQPGCTLAGRASGWANFNSACCWFSGV